MRHSDFITARAGSKLPVQFSYLPKVQLIVVLRLTKTLHSKKYGVDLPRFTHKNTAIIYASTKEDDTIRYHSLHDNKYLQYFRGHSQRVIADGVIFLGRCVDDGRVLVSEP